MDPPKIKVPFNKYLLKKNLKSLISILVDNVPY